MCSLRQLGSGLVVGIELGSEFVFDVVELDFEGFDQSGDGVTSGVLGFVPLEVEQVLADVWLLLDTLQVPFMELLVLEIEILLVDFFQETFDS